MDATSRCHQAVLNVDVFVLDVQHVQKSHQVKFWGGIKVRQHQPKDVSRKRKKEREECGIDPRRCHAREAFVHSKF